MTSGTLYSPSTRPSKLKARSRYSLRSHPTKPSLIEAIITMKAFATSILALFVLAIGVNAVAVDNVEGTDVAPNADGTDVTPYDGASLSTLDVSPCYWDGTAPFCAGSCPDGYVDCGRDSCGDGACCWTGIKVYCCRENSGQC
ncbi:hypothetical protein ONZ51_g6815 [Trametes cubensis]|uniref:Uncharacterized protein n=1 Tax=Trametes cubensis TaxID=1111947 RepID=A0AAD7XCD0_9APHY|nr:hypothetical protein ONZ51_g6815 [Trametes cubensis]